MASEESPAELFVGFVDSFGPDDRPEVLAISGGEAFLRPALVRELAERASLVGCRTMALSGMFWASERRIPPPIRRAIDALDHFSVSLDVFHEREVRREDVYRVLSTLLEEGKDVSVHLVGLKADDPYLVERSEEVHQVFDGRVPMLVNDVNSVGRAAQWLEPREELPSTMDAGPVHARRLAARRLRRHDRGVRQRRRRRRPRAAPPAPRPRGDDRLARGARSLPRLEHAARDPHLRARVPRRSPGLRRGLLQRLLLDLPAALERPELEARVTAMMARAVGGRPRGAGDRAPAQRRRAVVHEAVRPAAVRRARDPRGTVSATAPARLGWEEIEELRHDRGRSTLLFVTDRCPVGCAHCSVDSRRDSPTITDFELYGEILDWLCGQPRARGGRDLRRRALRRAARARRSRCGASTMPGSAS